jgi:hypothetical protein
MVKSVYLALIWCFHVLVSLRHRFLWYKHLQGNNCKNSPLLGIELYCCNELTIQQILSTLGNNVTLINVLSSTVIYSAVSLIGYYFSALTVDIIGRARIQGFGFLVVGIIYLICGIMFHTLQNENIIAFQALFYISSLFIQWGPNATTWLLPGELFPTDIRSEAHGLAAASGKLGALVAALAFSLGNGGKPVSAQIIFIVGGISCLVGFVLTVIFVADTTTLHLSELDKRWENELNSREYIGPAKCWENLSYFECWLFKVTPSQSTKNLSHESSSAENGAGNNQQSLQSDHNQPTAEIDVVGNDNTHQIVQNDSNDAEMQSS